jgi:hypothetical protein
MPIPPERLDDICHAILDAVATGYTTASAALPGRRYVSAGAPAWDCEQVVVHAERVYGQEGDVRAEAPAAYSRHPGHTMRAVEAIVTIIRCAPAVTRRGQQVVPPTVESEEAVAALVHADMGLVLNSLITAERAGDLPGCNSIAFMQWQAVPVQGDLVGSQQRVRVGLHIGV